MESFNLYNNFNLFNNDCKKTLSEKRLSFSKWVRYVTHSFTSFLFVGKNLVLKGFEAIILELYAVLYPKLPNFKYFFSHGAIFGLPKQTLFGKFLYNFKARHSKLYGALKLSYLKYVRYITHSSRSVLFGAFLAQCYLENFNLKNLKQSFKKYMVFYTQNFPLSFSSFVFMLQNTED